MQLYLLLTEECNLACDFCIRGKQSKGRLDFTKWLQILNENDFRKYTLMLTGGEPTIHEQFLEFVLSGVKHFKMICVNTNGINSDWIEKIEEGMKRLHVQISIDGTESVHNQLRSRGKFDIYSNVKKTMEMLEKKGISYNISTTVNKENQNNIFVLEKELAKQKMLKYWKVSPALPFGCSKLEDCLSIQEWNRLVEKLLVSSKIQIRVKKLYDFELLDRYIKTNKENSLDICRNCGDVKSKIYVYPDLTVYPCTCLKDFSIGNLYYSTLKDIISSSEAMQFSEYQVKRDSACYTCNYLKYCNGGCIGMSYNVFGELGRGDYRCPIVQKKEHLILK